MMRIMVIGSAGFLGQHILTELAGLHDVVGVDLRKDPLLEDVSKRENIDRLLGEYAPEVVLHLAAKVGRLFGENDLMETVRDNAGMTAVVAEACASAGARLAYASTSEIYGDCGDTLAYEAMLPRLPHNLYGLSKRWGEEACQLYAPDGLQILRFSMPYGPGLPWGIGRAAIVNFINQALEREPIPVHRGSERSWCYVGDTARAARLVLESGQAGAFNVGRDDDARPLAEVAQIACDLVGADRNLIEETDPPDRQTVVKRLATEKVRALGWEPRVRLWDGMEIVRDWILEQKALLASA